VKFLPEDPNVIISGGWDTNVHIWDLREQKSVGSFLGPKIAGDSLDFKKNIILTGSNSQKD
jgi:COMPASS component SWD3